MKVLLVDNFQAMRNIWKEIVSRFDSTEIREAGDGVEGLAAIAEHGPFDLILVDRDMPNMNGLEMVTKVRETDKLAIIIMVTTEAEKSCIIEAVKAGVNSYVVKPFTPEILLGKIEGAMKKSVQTT